MKRIFTLLWALPLVFIVACGPAEVSDEEASDGDTGAATGDTFTTDSGLQVEITEQGDGEQPGQGDVVRVDYTLTLEDGTVVDTSEGRGPFEFTVGAGQVIPGWDEGIALLNEGSSAILTVPPDLGYGAQGAGGVIPPNATLTFDVTLVEILPPPPPTPTPAPPTAVDEADYVETESGLRYAILQEGAGDTPEVGGSALVNFKGWLEDGTLFADSYQAGQPLEFRLGAEEIIAAWDEAVLDMQAGEIRQIVVPPELGLGDQGSGPIPPNSTLIFEMELVSFEPPPPPPTEVDEESFIETESGLRYAILEEGDGPLPEAGQVVSVHYTGWLTNSIQFDSSYDRGQPIQLPIGQGQVIQGWDEALQLLPVGTTAQVIIPGELAYGETGRPGIPPNSTLIFEMEILEIVEQEQPVPTAPAEEPSE
jgi:peptidylprolyl isomerase